MSSLCFVVFASSSWDFFNSVLSCSCSAESTSAMDFSESAADRCSQRLAFSLAMRSSSLAAEISESLCFSCICSLSILACDSLAWDKRESICFCFSVLSERRAILLSLVMLICSR